MSETRDTTAAQSVQARSRRDRRAERYREIASVLWDERVLFLLKHMDMGGYAPSGASFAEISDWTTGEATRSQ